MVTVTLAHKYVSQGSKSLRISLEWNIKYWLEPMANQYPVVQMGNQSETVTNGW